MPSVRPPSFRPAATPELRAHQQWLGYVQPVGLVVSLPALERAQCYVNKNVAREQAALLALVEPKERDGTPSPGAGVRDLAALCRDVFGWEERDLVPAPESVATALPEYGEVLSPEFVVPSPDEGAAPQALVSVVPRGLDLDKPRTDTGWQASPETRFERMLKDADVPVGLLFNETQLRLVYAPRGESSGHVTFDLAVMCEPAGRPILGAMHALLAAERLFALPTAQRLPAILKDSRKYQNEVSTKLSEQVLDALYELLRGFQAADQATGGALLGDVLRNDPNHVYGGLLATLLRLVFVLYAEDRGMLPGDPIYAQHYAATALFEKLREDAARYPDTMNQRYGAWSRVLALFRLLHDGGRHGAMRLPPRHGRMFDPDAYPFLEGRPYRSVRQQGERLDVPRVSDAVVYHVLDSLLVLGGDRLSYRALDVEQIGSVYEAMMGYAVEVVAEPSIAVRPSHVVVGLESLLKASGPDRLKRLADEAGCKPAAKSADAVKQAKTLDALVAALGKSISPRTPEVLPAGGLALQPTEERRRSGSHYTPRSLTEPIVATTLRPLFEAFGGLPTPEQILDLKLCDPAMGSGAFLVAACRALGEKLVDAWQRHGTPAIPPDEDIRLYAQRVVAQRCLYGVDKNPFAVDLAKLSLWLVTLAKDHPFTFLDHALRQGDSLVGLSREQIASFHWAPDKQVPLLRPKLDEALSKAVALRAKLHELGDSDDTTAKRHLLDEADAAIRQMRCVGDLVIDAFFSGSKDKERKARLASYAASVASGLDRLPQRDDGTRATFHWELEFPEVFARANAGFDAVAGNPPFAGKNTLLTMGGDNYIEWLKALHEEAHGNADLVAHFFRRAFSLLRHGGTFGLIATNTIAQGDTRSTGLRWICQHRGVIYHATRRYKWPGLAAVIVSVVHVQREPRTAMLCVLDGKPAARISAFLFDSGGDSDPVALLANARKSFVGSYVLGMGFTFDDGNPEATPIAEMHRLIAKDPRNKERIFPYLGGEELNARPSHEHHRYVINFEDMSESEARAWPDLIDIVENKAKPGRVMLPPKNDWNRNVATKWWQFGAWRRALKAAALATPKLLTIARVSRCVAFAFTDANTVHSEQLVVFATGHFSAFASLQARPHEAWVRFFASSMKDDLRYTPSDCFETFPCSRDWNANEALEDAGSQYYAHRAALMVANNEGMTATYNRFHDPDERDPGILELRALHDAMDRAVLDAYGWQDIQPVCEFLLDYDDGEDEEQPNGRRAKKKPWRYRWPDEVRDEVLARLLALNAERAAEERDTTVSAGEREKNRRPKRLPRDDSRAGDEREGLHWPTKRHRGSLQQR